MDFFRHGFFYSLSLLTKLSFRNDVMNQILKLIQSAYIRTLF